MTSNPITSSYRRFLIDIHTPDWDPRFLADFSASHLARSVAEANATTITVPANNHVGLNFWPSSVGRPHRVAADRDLLAEMLAAARAAGLNTVVYYAIAYVEWYWEQHPESRFVFADGQPRRLRLSRAGMADRFRVVCHNDPGFREFALTQLTEIATGYDLDGVNIDMTMWPGPCYCGHCRHRFREEAGAELPPVADWSDPVWREFARRRAAWLAEAAKVFAERVRSIRPDATVVHQSGPYFSDWWIGGSDSLAAATDWLSADTYATREGISFALKLSNSLSRVKPAELINTWTAPAIFEHVVPRTPDEQEAVASLAIAHDCALSVIDAVDPSGRIADPNYPIMAGIFERVRELEPQLGGTMLHEVEILRSFRSTFDEAENGRSITDLRCPDEREEFSGSPSAHHAAAISAGGALQAAHLPFGVVSSKDLAELDPRKVLVLANVQWLDPAEVDAIEAFLQAGGRVYASGRSPLLEDDRFGLRRTGRSHGIVTYVAPVPEQADLFLPFDARRPLTVHGAQELVEASGPARVVATVTLPYIEPGGERYASTLADPPGVPTSWPSILELPVGAGRLMYSAGVIEAETHPTQRAVFVRLIEGLLGRPAEIRGRGPRCVEITAFDRGSETVVFALNRPAGDEPVPVRDFVLELRLGRAVREVRLLPEGTPLEHVEADGLVTVTLPEFRNRCVVAVRG